MVDRKPDGLKGGQIWWSEILRQIQCCQIFLFCCQTNPPSQSRAQRNWKKREAAQTIIPVFLETYSSKDYPTKYSVETRFRLEETQYVDLRSKGRFEYDDLSELWGAINRAQRPSLTRTERWMLYNQYRIINLLESGETMPEQKETEEQSVLAFGFELSFEQISSFLNRGISSNIGEEVYDILDMYRGIDNARIRTGGNRSAVDFSNIETSYLTFGGFDGNHESEHYVYAVHLLREQKLYGESMLGDEELNSHWPMLPVYHRMLKAWHESDKPFCLTREDIVRIASAADHDKK